MHVGNDLPCQLDQDHQHFPIVPYAKLCIDDQKIQLLKWVIMNPEKLDSIIKKEQKVSPDDITKEFPDALLDSDYDMNLNLIEEYFNPRHFKKLLSDIQNKQKTHVFICKMCSKAINNTVSYVTSCDRCFCWYHNDCAKLNENVKGDWFCYLCASE